MKLNLECRGRPYLVEIDRDGDHWTVRMPDGKTRTFGASRLHSETIELTIGDRILRVPFLTRNEAVEVSFEGVAYGFSQVTAVARRNSEEKSSGKLAAPMVGIVTAVLVEDGDRVKAYQPLIVIGA